MRTFTKIFGGLIGLFLIVMVIGALSSPEPTTGITNQTINNSSSPVHVNNTISQVNTSPKSEVPVLTVVNGKYNKITRYPETNNIDDATWQTDICPKCGYKDTESDMQLTSSGGISVQKCPECGYTFYRDANPSYNPYYYQGFYDKEMGDYLTGK